MRIAIFLLGGIVFFATGCANKDRGENEVEVTLDQVPPAAREALARESGGAPMGTVRREMENGKPVYEATFTSGGKSWEVEVDENGKVLDREKAD